MFEECLGEDEGHFDVGEARWWGCVSECGVSVVNG